ARAAARAAGARQNATAPVRSGRRLVRLRPTARPVQTSTDQVIPLATSTTGDVVRAGPASLITRIVPCTASPRTTLRSATVAIVRSAAAARSSGETEGTVLDIGRRSLGSSPA